MVQGHGFSSSVLIRLSSQPTNESGRLRGSHWSVLPGSSDPIPGHCRNTKTTIGPPSRRTTVPGRRSPSPSRARSTPPTAAASPATSSATSPGRTHLVLDLRMVDFFGTAGFATLHNINVICARGGATWVLQAGRRVRRLLEICDPDDVLPLEAAAVSARRRPRMPGRSQAPRRWEPLGRSSGSCRPRSCGPPCRDSH